MRDNLNDVGVLKRREIEARIIAPLLQAFADEIGADKAQQIVRQVIVRIAEEQGQALAAQRGNNRLSDFADTLEPWTRDGALELEVLEQSDVRLSFNVTRCRYAEMYKATSVRRRWVPCCPAIVILPCVAALIPRCS